MITPYARKCSSNIIQLWKLNQDSTLRPKQDASKFLFLIKPGEGTGFQTYGFKVLPCKSSYRNKRFNFEYLTQQMESEPKLHTFFKIKVKSDYFGQETWQGENLCLAWRPIIENIIIDFRAKSLRSFLNPPWRTVLRIFREIFHTNKVEPSKKS